MYGDGKSFIFIVKFFGDGIVCVMWWDLFCLNNFVSFFSKFLMFLYEVKMELFKNFFCMCLYIFNMWCDFF